MPGKHKIRFQFKAPLLILAAAAGVASATQVSAEKIQDLTPEYDLTAKVQAPGGQGEVRVDFNTNRTGGYTLLVSPQKMTLLRKDGQTSTPLASTGEGLASAAGHSAKIVIKRRAGRIAVLEGSRVVMNVEDSTFGGGVAQDTPSGGATVSSFRVQPVEPLYFTDDFMRQPTEPGEWTYAKGNWKIQTVGIVERGANPFSLESQPGPTALADTGYGFWSDYNFQCAAKGPSDAKFGMCVDLQDPDNYYMLRWSPGAQGALELVRVVAGKPTVLGHRAGGFIPHLWYQLGLRTVGGHLVAEVDHQSVFDVLDSTFGEGKIGLYSEGADTTEPVYFDSVEVRPANSLYDSFSAGDLHHWQIQSAKAVGGDPTWKNYAVTAQVVGGSAMASLPFRYENSANYYAFAWSPQQSELVAVVNGQHKTLDTSTEGIPVGQSHTVQVGADGGYLWAAIDGKRVAEALDFDLRNGRLGYSPAAAGGHSIRTISAELAAPVEPFDALTAEMTNSSKHPDMKGWAGPLHAWEVPDDSDPTKPYWHKEQLYGNTTVKVPLIPQDLQDGQFGVVLNADGIDPKTGYEVDYAATGTSGITLTMLRLGQKVATAHLKAPSAAEANGDQPITLDVYRMGRFIFAGIGDDMPLHFSDSQPLDGYTMKQAIDYAPNTGGHSRLALIVRGNTPLDMADVTVNNRHVYSETFHLAPINWRPQSGTWEVTSRWSCQPGWTWYGGKDVGYAVNWHKTPLWGDQTIDYYASAMMSAIPEAGTEAWRDLNCSFCADGTNIFSGYTLLVGGWQNSTTRLFRKGKLVAETDKFHFPPAGVAHRLWYDIHIVKQGGDIKAITSYVDASGQEQNQALLDYTDPQPLSGGFVSFWTYKNGMMLARAVLSYQQKGVAPIYTASPVWTAREPNDAPYPNTPDSGLAVNELKSPDASILQPIELPAVQKASTTAHPTTSPTAAAAPAGGAPTGASTKAVRRLQTQAARPTAGPVAR